MKQQKQMKKLPLSLFEIVWYSLMAGLGLWGLTYIVLGLVAAYAPIPDSENKLVEGNAAIVKAFKLGFFGWGLIILAIAAVCAVIALLLTSRKADREFEKSQRRAAIRASARKVDNVDEAEIIKAQEEYKKEIEENRTTQEVVEEPEEVEQPVQEEQPVEEPKAEEPAPEAESKLEPVEKKQE